MRDTRLDQQIPGLRSPWRVTPGDPDRPGDEVRVHGRPGDETLCWPTCGEACPGYAPRATTSVSVAGVLGTRARIARDGGPPGPPGPRGAGGPGQCGDHGGTQRAGPWAEPGSRFTALFEAWGDAWLKEASIAEGYEPLGEAGCGRIESVTMAMGPAFTTAPHQHRPAAATKRAFEKFHVAQPPGASGGQVPRSEHKAWRAAGDDSLKGSRSFWLRHPEPMSDRAWPVFPGVACEPIEAGPGPGDPGGGDELGGVSFASGGSEGGGRGWPWAIRSRLEPIKRSAGG